NAPFTGLIHFPYARAREALDRLARGAPPDPYEGHLMRYTDPVDGGWAMATIAPSIRRLPAGFATRPYRASDSAIFASVEGRGELRVGGLVLDMAPHDVAVVPGWIPYTLHAAADWTLFPLPDRAAQDRPG